MFAKRRIVIVPYNMSAEELQAGMEEELLVLATWRSRGVRVTRAGASRIMITFTGN